MTRIYVAIISVFRTIGYDEDAVYSIVEPFTDRTVAYYWMHDRMESEESRYGGPSNIRISGTIESYYSDDIEEFTEDMKMIQHDREIEEARKKARREATEGGDSA